jgi:predicted TIM-barrel fold metal-dependent hydrolase
MPVKKMADRLIVDCHVHLYRTPEEGERGKVDYEIWEYGPRANAVLSDAPGDPDSAREAMAAAGVRYAVVPNLFDVPRQNVPFEQDLGDFNRWLCRLAREDDRFVPLVAVEPVRVGVAESVAELERLVATEGAAGIKLHPPLQRLDLADESVWPIFEACRRLDVVVLSHSGPTRSGGRVGSAEPDAFRPALAAFPGLRIVLAHLGGASWRQSAAVARDFPDVRWDLCEIIESLGARNAPTATELVGLIREIGPDRVLMGSDFPWYDMGHTIELVEELPALSAGERDAILGENAAAFFRLDA